MMVQADGVGSAAGVRLIGREEVAARLDYPSLIEALRRTFLDHPAAPERLSLPIPGEAGAPEGRLLVMPIVRAGGLIVVKLVTVHPALGARPGGALRAVLLALDAATGDIRGMVDGHSLTNRRTAATCALAAQAMAASRGGRLLVVGAGAVARELVLAHASALTLDEVGVWARRAEAADALVADLRRTGLPAVAARDLDEAVAAADFIAAATLSQAPLVRGDRVRAGAHVSLVGGFTPRMREGDDALMRRARVVVDDICALTQCGDLVHPIASGALEAAHVLELADLLRPGGAPEAPADVTVFKSVGRALEDLAAAELLFERLP